MSIAVSETTMALCAVTVNLPIGTNLALLHFLWMQLSGALLPSRGALFPALLAIGLVPAAVRRAWAAFRYGAWEADELLLAGEQHVLEQGQWQAHQYEGYYPKPVDLTAYWRPSLRGVPTKHFHALAGKALPAVVLGVIARVGSVNGQRVAILTHLMRVDPDDPSEASLQVAVVRQVAATLADDEMPVLDAGFEISQLQAAELPRYLVRLAKNFTGRRNELPVYEGHGRPPERGDLVRPLARTHEGKVIPATPPDRVVTWTEHGIQFRAEFWDDLVLPDVKVHPDNPTFTVAAIYDPRFQEPWLLACPLQLSGPAWRGLYRDRRPVEQVPLAGGCRPACGRRPPAARGQPRCPVQMRCVQRVRNSPAPAEPQPARLAPGGSGELPPRPDATAQRAGRRAGCGQPCPASLPATWRGRHPRAEAL